MWCARLEVGTSNRNGKNISDDSSDLDDASTAAIAALITDSWENDRTAMYDWVQEHTNNILM